MDAVRIATADVYPTIAPPAGIVSEERGEERRAVFSAEGFGFPPEARLVVVPDREGFRLAWEVRVAEPSLFTSYVIVVDAADGRLVYRENTTLYAEAAYLHGEAPYPMTEEFAPAAYFRSPIPASTPQSPIGWITGTGTSPTGNNASSHLGHRSMAGLSEPSGIYDYPFNTPRSSLVNAWWWANEAHDRFTTSASPRAPGTSSRTTSGSAGWAGTRCSWWN